MKHIEKFILPYLVALLLPMSAAAQVQPTDNILPHIPDQNFRNAIRQIMPQCDTDGDGKLSSAEAAKVEELSLRIYVQNDRFSEDLSLIIPQHSVYPYFHPKQLKEKTDSLTVKSLKGIEYFTGLVELYCADNDLTELDLSQNINLETLICYNNNISKLNVSKNTKLKELECSYNNLSELDVSSCSELNKLGCYSNHLSELNLTENSALEMLDCGGRKLQKLRIGNCSNLKYLDCSDADLTELDLSGNVKLNYLNTRDNPNLKTVWVWEGFDTNNPQSHIHPVWPDREYENITFKVKK